MSYGRGGVDVEESLAALQKQQEEDNYDDDDNAQEELDVQQTDEDPLLLAVDDLEGRVVNTLDDVQSHPGTRSDPQVTIHEELAALLRPVLEVSAHTGPSIARTYYRGGEGAIDAAVNDVYDRIVSDLVLPTLLEIARDTSPTKRAASLEFLKGLYTEWHKTGSWLSNPYGSGHVSHMLAKQREEKKRAREWEILRYWVQASIACTTPGTFTDEQSDAATAARGVIAASASLRPSLRHIVVRIKDADDRGANQVYRPVMKMVEGVIRKLLSNPTEAVLSACVKFLEIVILCCSRKPQESSRRGKRDQSNSQDFSLEDLPEGHPVITRQALESVAEYAFTTLRGLTLLGGQVKTDKNLTASASNLPSANVVNLLKPAALAYLEVESSIGDEAETSLDVNIDRSKLTYEFWLGQKSYALTVNAMSAIALNRPVFFKKSSLCIARRAISPPLASEGGLPESAVKLISSQLRSSCLTLLRNSLSIPSGASDALKEALDRLKMGQQAEKALGMAKQAHRLKSAGRAERNRANMHYEWETTVNIQSDLADIRKRKAERGLGNGIQLPFNMTAAIELIFLNLPNLPAKRPEAKPTPKPLTLESLVDAVMTNGASLLQEEGRWYERDGATTWSVNKENSLTLDSSFLESLRNAVDEKEPTDEPSKKKRRLIRDQCALAAEGAISRVVTTSRENRNKSVQNFGNQVAARLSFALKSIEMKNDEGFLNAQESAHSGGAVLETFAKDHSLVSSCLCQDASKVRPTQADSYDSLEELVLIEALLQGDSTSGDKNGEECFDQSLRLVVTAAVRSSKRAQEKPGDGTLQQLAVQSVDQVAGMLLQLPRLTAESITLLCGICDIGEITRKSTEVARKASQDSIEASAAVHAARMSAERRATKVLLVLRDICFHRDGRIRSAAVEGIIGIASGRSVSSPSIQDKALKLAINVIFERNDALANAVVEASKEALQWASSVAVERYKEVSDANKIAEAKNESLANNSLIPHSDVEKTTMDTLRKPVLLFMALCLRRIELIGHLFKQSCVENADVLSKTGRSSMIKLARAVATKYGATTIAMDVAEMSDNDEIPMLLSFLENLSGSPDDELIETCLKIQDLKSQDAEKKDPRFIIPVVASMKRAELIKRLPEFIAAEDSVFLAACIHCGKRVGRHALIFRDEPNEEDPTLRGMTLCEQLVFLHKVDFAAADIPRNRWLAAISHCLKEEHVYNDRVAMAALDYMSGAFLSGQDQLPLPFMRTCIQVFALHETLHSWFASDLLPRLVEGKIYEDARQWEGWMRCTHMLEESEEQGVNASIALAKLPAEQQMIYKTKWAGR